MTNNATLIMNIYILGLILTRSEIEKAQDKKIVVENPDGTVNYISDVNALNGTVRGERPGDRFAPGDKGD